MEEAKPQILLWTAPECPFRVTIPATVLDGIRILAVEAFYSVPRGGVEVGGVMFGVREADQIHIRAHRPIRCQYVSGPSFTLSAEDQRSLSTMLDDAAGDPDLAGMTPLGWYHSHTRSELFLSPADLQLHNKYFREKWQVAMVLRPGNLQLTRAGLFFRDRSGHLKSDAPVKEFKLEPPAFGLALLNPEEAGAVPPEAPAAAQKAVRAAPVVAEKAIPAPPAVSPSVEPVPVVVSTPVEMAEAVEIAPVSTPVLPVSAVAAAGGNGTAALTVAPPEIRSPEPIPEDVEMEPQPEEPVEAGLPSFGFLDAPDQEKRKIEWYWIAAVAALLLVAFGAYLKWGRAAKSTALGLETYDINGAFLIRWDRESSVILGANRAMLEIEDGGEKTPIELAPAELEVGGYGYMRRTARVSVRMKVDGSPPVEEYSIFKGGQALGSEPEQMPDASDVLSQTLREKEHLKTELINESMQSAALRQEITSLRKQLAEERAKGVATPER